MSLTGRLGRFCPSRDHLIAGCQLSFRRVKNFRTKNLTIFLARFIKVSIFVACGKFLQLRLDWFYRESKREVESEYPIKNCILLSKEANQNAS